MTGRVNEGHLLLDIPQNSLGSCGSQPAGG